MTVTFSSLGKFGRLGNQMFQIASTIGIATRNNLDFTFPEWSEGKELRNTLPTGSIDQYHRDYVYLETSYKDIDLSPIMDYDLHGYFQSYKYFEHCKETIYHYLDYPDLKGSIAKNFIAIHVRRGDYVALQHIHPLLTMDYYNKAMSEFPNSKFLVFTDDYAWCYSNFIGDQFTIWKNNKNPLVDLLFMSHCSGFIIANSSYSWWGAYLAKDKPVVAPKIWALNESPDSYLDRLPKEWKVLDNGN